MPAADCCNSCGIWWDIPEYNGTAAQLSKISKLRVATQWALYVVSAGAAVRHRVELFYKQTPKNSIISHLIPAYPAKIATTLYLCRTNTHCAEAPPLDQT